MLYLSKVNTTTISPILEFTLISMQLQLITNLIYSLQPPKTPEQPTTQTMSTSITTQRVLLGLRHPHQILAGDMVVTMSTFALLGGSSTSLALPASNGSKRGNGCSVLGTQIKIWLSIQNQPILSIRSLRAH